MNLESQMHREDLSALADGVLARLDSLKTPHDPDPQRETALRTLSAVWEFLWMGSPDQRRLCRRVLDLEPEADDPATE